MATKKTSARRASTKKSKASARKPIKSAWLRHTALSDTAKISVPKENPFREGTARFKGFEAIRQSKTVGKLLEKDRNFRRALLRNLVHEKIAKVG